MREERVMYIPGIQKVSEILRKVFGGQFGWILQQKVISRSIKGDH